MIMLQLSLNQNKQQAQSIKLHEKNILKNSKILENFKNISFVSLWIIKISSNSKFSIKFVLRW